MTGTIKKDLKCELARRALVGMITNIRMQHKHELCNQPNN